MRSLRFARRCRRAVMLLFALSACGCAYLSKQSVVGACRTTLDSPIRNFCSMRPNTLWRGARPDKHGAAWLIQHGVRTIVNLELVLGDKPAFSGTAVASTHHYEAGYFRVRDWEPLHLFAPSIVDDHVAHFLAIVGQQPSPIYVHCRYGIDRTGVMVAAYRIFVEGESAEQAIKEMRRYHGAFFAADAKYIRGLSPARRAAIRHKITQWTPKLKSDGRIVCQNGTCGVADR